VNRYNIRVYGNHVGERGLLVTDEIRLGIRMTKLPGGGLKFGEGLADGLRREWREELDVEIEVGDIFYVNPFLQLSAFNREEEVIAMYFRVFPRGALNGRFTRQPMDFPDDRNDQQVFRWVSIDELTEEVFTFPIDKSLVPRLKAAFS
jgi:ADP-ribose pyrophosphatase YjhB (NUDIX family)